RVGWGAAGSPEGRAASLSRAADHCRCGRRAGCRRPRTPGSAAWADPGDRRPGLRAACAPAAPRTGGHEADDEARAARRSQRYPIGVARTGLSRWPPIVVNGVASGVADVRQVTEAAG